MMGIVLVALLLILPPPVPQPEPYKPKHSNQQADLLLSSSTPRDMLVGLNPSKSRCIPVLFRSSCVRVAVSNPPIPIRGASA